MARDMYGTMLGPSAWMMTADWDLPHLLLLWAMWAVMMTAMMLPSASPLVLLYAGALRTGGDARVGRKTYAMAGGYVLVWALYSVAATALQRVLAAALILTPMMEPAAPAAAAVLLAAAGLYQLTPLKRACLRVCRSPLPYLLQHWRAGTLGAFLLGARHGANCLGCCWALMLLLFAGGVMNLAVIVALTLWVLAEKFAPFGEQTARVERRGAARHGAVDGDALTGVLHGALSTHRLRAAPGEGGVLGVVAAARIRPRDAERRHRLSEGRARLNVSAAGCPVFDSCRGAASGLRPVAGRPVRRILLAALTDQEAPSSGTAMGDDSTPRNLPTSPDTAAMGPPAAPLAIPVMASRCSALARSSTTTPTDQFPFAISSGVTPTTTNPRPSSGTWPKLPRSIWKAMAKMHVPFVGFTIICPEARAHEIAIAVLVILAGDLPGWCCHIDLLLA